MNFNILTIFPDFFQSVFSCGLIHKAINDGTLTVTVNDLRKYTTDKHHSVDDRPYGGGSGMLFKAEPAGNAIMQIKDADKRSVVVATSPQGKLLNSRMARELADYEQLILLCGRYEGIDQRINELYVDEEISIGDYILSGGEYAAAVIVDTVSRFLPGVVGNQDSVSRDSYEDNLLKYPQYTRPEEYRGMTVPDVLLSGDHNKIRHWRREQAIKNTFLKRPEMLDYFSFDKDEYDYIRELQSAQKPDYTVYIALVHYPVYNRERKVITSAFTNLDVHDIARASKTYGIEKFYLINPVEEQQQLARRVMDHWKTGKGSIFNPTRKEALEKVVISGSLDSAVAEIEKIHGQRPKIITTDAKFYKNMIGYNKLKEQIYSNSGTPYLLLFGTGWGLADEVMVKSDYILKPVKGYNYFNHLSVRSAAAIILDRLFGCKI